MALDNMVVEDSLDQTNLQPQVDDTSGKDEANSKEVIEPETSPKQEKKKRKKRVQVVVEEQQQVPKTTVADEETNDERKSKVSRVLPYGLRQHITRHGFDHKWVEEQVLEEMVNKWKTYKLAEVASDLAEAEFHLLFNTWALKAYNIFGYLEESS
ncbi:hypothetical protein ACLB2K_002481 [Fragaria x ananassa]